MKIISFISRKGGTGKTTNATHLAVWLHNQGHRVILLETDPNYTISTLRQIELGSTTGSQETGFEVRTTTDEESIAIILNHKRKDDGYIIVDSAGKTTDKYIRQLCLESDLIVVPTSLPQNDILVAYQTIQEILPATKVNKDLQIVVLPNRIHSQTGLNTLKERLDVLQVPFVQNFVPQRKQYAEFSTLKLQPEYEATATEILSYL